MSESQFAVLRIALMMVSSDGVLHLNELVWFRHITKNFKATPEQIDTLLQDRRGPRNIELIYEKISQAEDRERLLTWLKVIMNADGVIHPYEKALYERVLKCHEEAKRSAPTTEADLAKSIVGAMNEAYFWKELSNFGNFLSQSTRFGSSRLRVQLFEGRRLAFWFFLGFSFLLGILRACLQFPHR